MRRYHGLTVVRETVDFGQATLIPDADRPRASMLLIDGAPQSYVDLDDPTYLEFEYVRWLGHVVDLVAPPGRPLHVLHLGGGALTLPRYVAATRPRSRQQVVEVDAALVELVRRELPLERACRPRIRTLDAREALARAPEGSADLVVTDVFGGSHVPAHLTSVEFVREAARVLRDHGLYATNIADGPPLAFARAQVATLRAVFARVCLIAEPGVLRGRRFGNLVLLAGRHELPTAGLTRRLAGGPFPARLQDGSELDDFTGGAAPVRDATAAPSPGPPQGVFDTA